MPPGYVDKFPQRGTWFSVETPPRPYQASIEVLLPDGTCEAADYLPAKPPARPQPMWWRKVEFHPIAWRSFAERDFVVN